MAKIPFSKIDTKVNSNVSIVQYTNSKNEIVDIEVKYYLPIEEKMEMISKIINQSLDENGFYNPIKIQLFTVIETISFYTNLTFNAKQKENIFKTYDIAVSSNLFNNIIEHISANDWEEIQKTIITTIENIYKYKNSVMGIIDTVSQDYSAVDFDLSNIQEKLSDPNSLSLLKEIVPLLNTNLEE